MKKAILIILIILTLAFIWGNSLAGRETSTAQSTRLLDILSPILNFFGFDTSSDLPLRKAAHFVEFSILGLELAFLFGLQCPSFGKKSLVFLSVSHGVFAGLIDETIQIFSGRNSSVSDIWLDSFGALCGAAVAVVFLHLRNSKKAGKERR